MSEPTIRVYSKGNFTSEPVPGWYREAMRLCHGGGDWHKALSTVLDAESNSFPATTLEQAAAEVIFWRSRQHGAYVEISNVLGLIEEVSVPDDADWLPFLSTYLAPVASAMLQAETAYLLERVANTLIAWGRHGQGEHIDRTTGHSHIDERRDRALRSQRR
jgi:hypothetical protein